PERLRRKLETLGRREVALVLQRGVQRSAGHFCLTARLAVLARHGGQQRLQRLLGPALLERLPKQLFRCGVEAAMVPYLIYVDVCQGRLGLLRVGRVYQRITPVLDLRVPWEQELLPE